MCGMAGVLSSNLIDSDLSILRNLLLLNMFRGEDSTGMFDVTPGQKPIVQYWKSVEHPTYFLTENYYPTWNTRWKKTKPLLAAIHCRAATQGKVKKENAHPFKHGHIIGMHNGTITEKFLNRDKFDTDSEAIFYNIYTHGIEKALGEIQGKDPAFALIWYDVKERSINFIRNSRRSLYYSEAYKDTLYWSSDDAHLKMGISANSYSKTVPFCTAFTTGTLYTIKLDSKSLDFTKTEIKEAEEPIKNYGWTNYDKQYWEKSSSDWLKEGKTSEEVGLPKYNFYKKFDKKSKLWFTEFQFTQLEDARKREKEAQQKLLPPPSNKVVDMTGKPVVEDKLNDDLPFDKAETLYTYGPRFAICCDEKIYQKRLKKGCACCASEPTLTDNVFWFNYDDFLCLDCTEELIYKDNHWARDTGYFTEGQINSITNDYNDKMYSSKSKIHYN